MRAPLFVLLFALFSILLLAACSTKEEPPTDTPDGLQGQGKPCTREDRCAEGFACSGLFYDSSGVCVAVSVAQDACERAEHDWGTWGMMQLSYCMRVNPDAGKPCTDNAQCTHSCIQQPDGTGACQRHETEFGCYTTLSNGEAGAALCVD